MLSRMNRLTKKKDFERVFLEGRGVKNALFAAKGAPGAGRFGFVVSKKVSLKATVRNKVKRRMRNAVHEYVAQITEPVDVVLVALPAAGRATLDQTRAAIKDLLKRLTLI